MMEAVDPAVEAAVLWLVQTILEVLLAGKMQAWIRQLGLAGDIGRLKSQIERVEAVVASVKGSTMENRPLARSLGRLTELLYDADDMVDELDYYRLQHQVEGGMIPWADQPPDADATGGAQLVDGPRDNSGILNRKKRSKAWEDFRITEADADGKPVKAECIHCGTKVRCGTSNETSVLRNHLKSETCKRKRAASEQTTNPSSAVDGAQNGATVSTHDSDRRKRMRTDEVSTRNAAANTPHCYKAEFCSRIQQITHHLQEATNEVQKLYGSGSVGSLSLCRNTVADPCRRTSSLVQHKMYGRNAEKDSIIKHMTGDKSDGAIIIPIVGIGGIGKTALAQLVYNDPTVQSKFDHRIWIWVSKNYDEMRLTTEMLDFVSQEKCVGISSLAKLQEILVTHVTSKRTLLVLDDVWDDIDGCQWNKLLAPWRPDNAMGNVIIVTTRKLCTAKRIGTVEPIKLGHLQNDDFWLLFKTCAFGDENYKEHPSLNIIAQQIAKKLHGNPLAAQTAGMLLREHLATEHWSSILKNEEWKSLHLYGGIMHALKHSYDELPYYLQQCFLYCSIFPSNHRFLSRELVSIWISQGFVKCTHSTMGLEETGRSYLTNLVNLGFFEQDQGIYYVLCGVMHNLARLVSRTNFATIDGLECNKIPPTVRHLSVVTDSVYYDNHDGSILRNEKFKQKLRSVDTIHRKLRTLVLIGKYDSLFIKSFLSIFQKARYLRMFWISETHSDFRYFLCNLESCTHLRYLKLENKGVPTPLPLRKFYHLQVLDVGRPTVVNGMNALVSIRHLVVKRGAGSFITNVNEASDHQHVQNFVDQNFNCFEISQLQSMKKLVQLGVFQLKNVSTAEAYGAKLRDKQHMEELHLSWNSNLSQDEYASDSSESNDEELRDKESEDESLPEDICDSGSEPSSVYMEPVEGSSPMNDTSNCNPISEHSTDTREVLEGLEPHHGLKRLRVSGYSGAISPAWLGTSVTCLRTLHLENCGKWKMLSSLGRLSFLTNLKLINMQTVEQVSVPSLEELVLIKMPKLERCFCNSVIDLNSHLAVLKIVRCRALKAFPLFESCEKLRIEHKSWLSSLSKLTIRNCPRLIVSNPLPPSSSACKLSIKRVLTLPTMKGSSNGELIIEADVEEYPDSDEDSNELTKLDHKILSFHNLRMLTRMQIAGCKNLSLEGLKQLISLKRLSIFRCHGLFYSLDVVAEHARVDMADANSNALSNLKYLSIYSGSISGKWLSVLLQHAPVLEELELKECHEISGLLIEGKECCLSNHNSNPWASLPGNQDDASTSSSREAVHSVLRIPLNLLSALKKMYIDSCEELTFQGNEEGFSAFASLEELTIWDCPKLISSLVVKDENSDYANRRCRRSCSPGEAGIVEPESLEKLQLCPRGGPSRLKKLEIWWSNSGLASLDLDSFTALEELVIGGFDSLTAIEGLQSLRGLRHLEVRGCPRLPPFLERLSGRVNELFPRLDRLEIDDYSFLTASFCKLLTSLQELRCRRLGNFPVCLHCLASLKRLEIRGCYDISEVPEMGLLPPSLEELVIESCSLELTEQFRDLATSMLIKVKINGFYVN